MTYGQSLNISKSMKAVLSKRWPRDARATGQ